MTQQSFGLGTNGWQVYETLFEQEFNIYAHRFNYDNLNGVQNAADDVLQKLQSQVVPTGANNILMGHSTGGVTARMMEHHPVASQQALMTQYFGGYITVGAPHRGIKLINSYQNGNLELYFVDGCQEVLIDPIVATTANWALNNGYTAIFAGITLFINTNSGELICSSAYSALESSDDLSLFLAPNTINDLKEGSSTLANLPTGSAKHRIFLYGNEESPVHWRFLSSLVKNPPVQIPPPPATYQPGDVDYVQTANTIKIVEEISGSMFFAFGIMHMIQGQFWNGLNSFLTGIQWHQGANWISNSESGWNNLIGANDWVTITQPGGPPVFTCWNIIEDIEADYEDGAIDFQTYVQQLHAVHQNPNCYTSGTVTITIPNNQISDGLATMINTHVSPGDPCHLPIDQANHQEEVHHPNAWDVYTKIFDGVPEITQKCGQDTRDFFIIN